MRRRLYGCGVLRSHRLAVPVVVVGNLIVGGAGKTPTVMATVAALRRAGWHPGIVSRGYRGSAGGVLEVGERTPASVCGDEPLLLLRRTGVPVVVGADRVAAGRHLLQIHPTVDIVVADDGLQHLALRRDVQIIVFDERGTGNGWLLPAGPLREPLPSAVPARTLVVYNAATPSTVWPGFRAEARVTGLQPLAAWRSAVGDGPDERPGAGESLGQGPDDGLAALGARPVLAAAGMGRPARFFGMLRELGLTIVPLALPDHHDFRPLPWPADTRDVVVTEKDAVKLDSAALGTTRVWVAPLDFRIDAAFDAALRRLLPHLP